MFKPIKKTNPNNPERMVVTAIVSIGLFIPEALAQESTPNNFSVKFMAFNIWNVEHNSKVWDQGGVSDKKFFYSEHMKNLLLKASPDILVLPELNNNNKRELFDESFVNIFYRNTIDTLNSRTKKQESFLPMEKNLDEKDKGDGTIFSSVPFVNLPGDTIKINPGNGFPTAIVTGIHLDHSDLPSERVSAAKKLNSSALTSGVPMVLVGDFNAGDVSERGLHRREQQLLLMRNIISKKNGVEVESSFYKKLTYEYLAEASKEYLDIIARAHPGKNINYLSWMQWADALNKNLDSGGSSPLQDESYPVLSNLPLTLNVFKKQYQLLQFEQHRELFKPSQVGDERATWASDGEISTNTWPSWDRVTIDHIMVSRPFAKWAEIADDGNPSGNLSKLARLPNGGSLSDHEPVAQNLRWVGPHLEVYEGNTGNTDNTDKQEKKLLVWGANAYNFAKKNKTFNLVRNNYRNDVYLGQVADSEGNPTLTKLSIEEKKSLLNCKGSDSRFQQAVTDYCIDDHSFIGETLVTDGGLLVVDEDKALGGSEAKLRLANGGLRVAGLSMGELDRDVVLEQQGWIDVAESGLVVSATKALTGTGSLTKLGAGTFALSGPNTYTGGTFVEEGILRAGNAGGFVNNTAYTINGGALDLNGFDLIASKLEGKGGSIQLGKGSLTIDQGFNTRYDGSIEGFGGLTKSGGSQLILNGQNSYTGATLVRDGRLVIGDSDHPDARLESQVTVGPGATLGGIGTVGALTINAGGTVAPGNSIGTLRAGDVTFDAGSVYSVEVAPNGRSDLIDSAGVATLNGGDVRVSLENRTNLLTEDEAKTLVGQTFNILTAKKGIVGQFSSVTPNYLFLDSQVNVPRTQQLLTSPVPAPLVEPVQPEPAVAVTPPPA
ncbi:autotransporter-associated beta strand repeat-containing protein, partial [Pseudomonas sp. B329]|uniref:autotransporter-associated beta strand repeat-containing protein n=1 Tax=Pseudomonas sp. B329 TaxID=1553459 RepID=UPI002002F162